MQRPERDRGQSRIIGQFGDIGRHAPFGRAVLGALVGVLGSVAALLSASPATATVAAWNGAHAVAPTTPLNQVWEQTIRDSSQTITASSPNVGDVTTPAGGLAPAVVVGDLQGNVYTFDLATGTPNWTYPAGGPVQSSPSVTATTAGSPGDSVFVGVGDAATPHPAVPGYQAITPQGTSQWKATETDPFGGPTNGVQASLSVGNLQGVNAVTAGSLGQEQLALNAANGAVLPGFPWFQGDSNFSTPALADMYGGGGGPNDIVEGGAASNGLAYGFQYQQGGYTRVVTATGNAGQPEANGGTLCQAHSDQSIDSSPAVGEFFGATNQVGMVVGTGSQFGGAADTDKVLAYNAHCGQAWSATLDGATGSSPALADVMGNGQLQVIEGTNAGTTGSVYALDGSTGNVLWKTTIGPVLGSVATVDIGNGHQDVIVGTSNGNGAFVLNGTNGAVVQTLLAGSGIGFQNSPLVTTDPNGTIGVTLAGYEGADSHVWHYEISGSNGAVVHEAGAWPQFHHDPQLTGDAGTNVSIQVPCTAPTGPPHGYDLSASDGGIFTFGNLPFCGSTGAITLNKPMVGMALTKDAGGYWEVASDGGIFAFGDAPFYGSTGAIHLNQPIVGMAPTPDGGGYWLVAADGGIFSFGDAAFYGSTGAIHLNKPIVGMAATPTGKGYWLVASDGGIFAFGDATFYGSTGGIPLNKPVVGMASTQSGHGYWLVASDGGIFAFGDAVFYGSTGAIHLNQPVVGMEATSTGLGYRFVAADGGIFCFGDAVFYGSMGGTHLNKPVVGMAGF